MIKIILLTLLLAISHNSYAEDAYKFINSNTFVKNPLDLRDPFKRRLNKKKTHTVKNNIPGVYQNYDDSIDNKPVESIKVVGVMTGVNRRAMIRVGKEKDTFIIREGMKVGPNQAEVKAILPGGVILLEKFRNVYDQDEYLETVLPVSND